MMMAHNSKLFIKSEPIDMEDASYCRCCFQLMSENGKVDPDTLMTVDPETKTLFTSFEEIMQVPVRVSQNASSFCFDCSVLIGSFTQFKKLAALKQKKFNEILDSNSNDFSSIFFLKLEGDPLIAIIKQETSNMSIMRNEETERPTKSKTEISKRSTKKVPPESLSCPICTKRVDDAVDHLRLCKGKQCNKCTFRSVDADEMEQHKREKHGPKKVIKHEDSFRESSPFSGDFFKNDDSSSSSSSESLQANRRTKRNRKTTRMTTRFTRVKEEVCVTPPSLIFCCDICGKEVFTKGAIATHITKHLKEKPIKCSLCPYSTCFKKYLKNHIRNRHDPAKPQNTVKKNTMSFGAGHCQECNKDFKGLRAHYERVHENIKNFQCQECDRECYNKPDLISHMGHKHKKQLGEIDPKFVCESCGKGFPRKQLYDLHKRSHLTLDFPCHLCEKKFAMKSRVEEHIKRCHLKIMEKECDVCGKRFFNNAKLNVHYNVHAGIKFHCFLEGCSAARSRRDAMVYHMKNDHQLSAIQREEFMEKLNAICVQLKKK